MFRRLRLPAVGESRFCLEQSFKKTSSLRLTEHIVNVCAQLEKLADELKRRHPLWKGCNRRGVGPRRREACRRSTVMLKVIEGANASFFPREMDAMFRNRAEVFAERLGWDVVVKGGYERDRFDDLNPVYLVSVDPVTERYWGSLRLLPTTGPNMLRDVFPQLLEEGEVVESATIWESSRICVSAVEGQPGRARNGVNYVLNELIAGIGETMAYAGLFEPNPDRLEAFRTELGMGHSVLSQPIREIAFA